MVVLSSFTPALAIALIDSHETRTSSSVLPISKSLRAFASAGWLRGSWVSARNFMRSTRVRSSRPPPVYCLVSGSTMVSRSCLTSGALGVVARARHVVLVELRQPLDGVRALRRIVETLDPRGWVVLVLTCEEGGGERDPGERGGDAGSGRQHSKRAAERTHGLHRDSPCGAAKRHVFGRPQRGRNRRRASMRRHRLQSNGGDGTRARERVSNIASRECRANVRTGPRAAAVT